MRSVPSDPTEHLWTPVTDGIAGRHLFPNALLNVPQSIALPIVDDHGRCLTIIRPDLEPEKAQNISGLSLDGSLDGTARVMELNQVGLNYPGYNQTTCIDVETF